MAPASPTPTSHLVVYERGPESWGAWVPDLAGCVAASESREDVERLIREAIPFHLAGMRAAGESIPPPSHSVGYVDVYHPPRG